MVKSLSTLTVAECWVSIERWLSQHHPPMLDRLADPASDEEIAQLEVALGVTLPAEYTQSLRIHAGGRTKRSKAGEPYSESPFEMLYLFAPDVVLARRQWLTQYASFPSAHVKVDGAVARAYHHPGWIPVAGGDEDRAIFYCIDTVPTVPAAAGQIVEMVTNDPERRAPWPSFRALLIDRVVRPIQEDEVDEACLADSGLIRFLPRA